MSRKSSWCSSARSRAPAAPRLRRWLLRHRPFTFFQRQYFVDRTIRVANRPKVDGKATGDRLMKTGKGRRWLVGMGWLAAFGGLAVVGVLFAAKKGQVAATPAAQEEKQPVAVTVEPITARPVRRAVPVVGSLYGQNEVTITPKVEGRVLKIHHDVGDVVKAGETLLEIDPTDYRLAVAEASR